MYMYNTRLLSDDLSSSCYVLSKIYSHKYVYTYN